MSNLGSSRRAGEKDIPVLVLHHRRMFEDIRKRQGKDLDPRLMEAMDRSYEEKLKEQLGSGACAAWILELEEKALASGAISILSMVPTPEDPSDRVAYVHGIYTEPSHRNAGLAHRIMEAILAHCQGLGIRRVQLHASDAGRPLYEKLDFTPVPEAMKKWLG